MPKALFSYENLFAVNYSRSTSFNLLATHYGNTLLLQILISELRLCSIHRTYLEAGAAVADHRLQSSFLIEVMRGFG